MKKIIALSLSVLLSGCGYGITCIDTKANERHDFWGSAKKCSQVEGRCRAMGGGELCDKWENLEEADVTTSAHGEAMSLGAAATYSGDAGSEYIGDSYIPGLRVQSGSHEYKHTLQSRWLGPLYLPAYGISKIPSVFGSSAPGWMDRQADVFGSNPDNWAARREG